MNHRIIRAEHRFVARQPRAMSGVIGFARLPSYCALQYIFLQEYKSKVWASERESGY
jgi:hypothetical protein